MSHVVVVIGGGPLSPRALEAIPDGATIIAADSGLDDAVASGLRPSVLVGDLDSVSAGGTMWAYAHELTIERYPEDKDATDTQLALRHACKLEAEHLVVVGGAGDRLDHTLGVIAALGDPELGAFETVTAVLGDTLVHVVHALGATRIACPEGGTFSMIALHGPCFDVLVSGAKWNMADGTMLPGTTIGISNVSTGLPVVAVGEGVLTVVVP